DNRRIGLSLRKVNSAQFSDQDYEAALAEAGLDPDAGSPAESGAAPAAEAAVEDTPAEADEIAQSEAPAEGAAEEAAPPEGVESAEDGSQAPSEEGSWQIEVDKRAHWTSALFFVDSLSISEFGRITTLLAMPC